MHQGSGLQCMNLGAGGANMRSLTLHICSGWASLASAWQRAPAHGRVRSQRQGVCPAPEACSVWGRRPSPPTRACRALPAPHRGVALLLRESLLLWKVQLLTLPSPTRGSCPRPHSPEMPTADSQNNKCAALRGL